MRKTWLLMIVAAAIAGTKMSKHKSDKSIVLSRNKKSDKVRTAYRKTQSDGTYKYKLSAEKPGDGWKSRFGNRESADAAAAWASKQGKKGQATWVTKSKYPYVVLNEGSEWGEPDLNKRLNKLGRLRKKYIRAGIKRLPKHKGSSGANCGNCQHCLRQKYYNVPGANLAAECSSKYAGRSHSHSQCDAACRSHHCVRWASDSGVYASSRGGSFKNLGHDDKCRKIMKNDVKLALNVSGEPWHCVPYSIDSVWRS